MESQYIYFKNSDPKLNYLSNNWETIRDEFNAWAPTLIGPNGLTKEDTRAKKLNYV